jgi:hypothetical protein
MTLKQYFLIKIAEEAAEVAQIALKAAHFRLSEIQPGRPETNAERMYGEINDLLAMAHRLGELSNGEFWFDIGAPDHVAIAAKWQRLSTTLPTRVRSDLSRPPRDHSSRHSLSVRADRCIRGHMRRRRLGPEARYRRGLVRGAGPKSSLRFRPPRIFQVSIRPAMANHLAPSTWPRSHTSSPSTSRAESWCSPGFWNRHRKRGEGDHPINAARHSAAPKSGAPAARRESAQTRRGIASRCSVLLLGHLRPRPYR